MPEAALVPDKRNDGPRLAGAECLDVRGGPLRRRAQKRLDRPAGMPQQITRTQRSRCSLYTPSHRPLPVLGSLSTTPRRLSSDRTYRAGCSRTMIGASADGFSSGGVPARAVFRDEW